MALDTIDGVSALNCAHFVLNSTSLQLIPAYSSQRSSFEETLAGAGIRRGLSERLKPIIEIEAVKMGVVLLGIFDAPVNLDTSSRTA
jgi:hypothetical protein